MEKGEEEHYVLAGVNHPKGTTTHALKGTKTGRAAEKALTAEVERLRRALAAKGQAGTGAAAPFPALPAPDDIDFGRYHALVIGINDYEYLPKLQTAVNDAK
ncbi:MAG: caspase family protein, partial [Proteobacteria bacterium]|nr:caspase family protein [Pseudomonadota bacterium]